MKSPIDAKIGIFFVHMKTTDTMSNISTGNFSCATDNLYFLAVPSAGIAEEAYAIVAASIVIPLSLVAIFVGYLLFQFFIGSVASITAGVAVIYALHEARVTCDIASWSAPAASVLAFGLGLCLARRASCLFGVVIGGAVPVLVFRLFPEIATIDTGETPNPEFLGFRLLPVWATVLFSSVFLGLVLCRYAILTKIISTAAVGSYGVVASVCLLIDPPANSVIAVVISVGFALGSASQYRVRQYRARAPPSRDRVQLPITT